LKKKSKRHRMFYILQRWTNIGLYALVGSAFVAYCGRFLADWTEKRLGAITGANSPAFLCVSIGILGIALWQCNRLAGARWNHLRWLLLYPPLPVAVVPSFLFAPLWPTISDHEQIGLPIAAYYAGILGVSYACFWLVQTLLGHLGRVIRARFFEGQMVPGWQCKTLDELTDEELREWLNTELLLTTNDVICFVPLRSRSACYSASTMAKTVLHFKARTERAKPVSSEWLNGARIGRRDLFGS